MTAWTGGALTQLQSGSFGLRWLLWLEPRTFNTGVVTPMGLWTGDTDETITVDGEARLYYGAQGGMDVPPIRYRAGTEIAALEIGLSLTPEGEDFARGYDTRMAPAELHAAVYDPTTWALKGTRRYFKGLVDGLIISTGDQSKATIKLVSTARRGTMTVAGKKSDQSQRLRDPADRFRQYGDLGTTPNDPWGGDD